MSAYHSKRPPKGQLPPNVQPGDKLRLVPDAIYGSEDACPMPCTVESIPSHRRFAVVRFEAGFRECRNIK